MFHSSCYFGVLLFVMYIYLMFLIGGFQGFMFSSKEDMRMYSAELFAVVMSGHADEDKCAQVVKELTRNVKEKVTNPYT